MEDGIDFVVTWVDGSDPAWRAEKARYSGRSQDDDSAERYREWGLFRYWFRGVEKFAPWVRKVHLITWGHLPGWLVREHPKLHIVRHQDYIPEEFLPVFNSNVLEIYMHRIEGLSRRFVYFNDDMYLAGPVKPEFFFKGGKPCDMLAFQPVVANPKNPVMSHVYLNNSLTLCKYFDKRENVRRQPGAYLHVGYPPLYFFYNILELGFPLFTGFYTVHGPSPFLRDTFEELWEKEGELLKEMSANRFRSGGDVTPYLFREWQKLSGNFHPCNIQKAFGYFDVGDDNSRLIRTLRGNKKKVVCVNDGQVQGEFEKIQAQLLAAFEGLTPERSSFERNE